MFCPCPYADFPNILAVPTHFYLGTLNQFLFVSARRDSTGDTPIIFLNFGLFPSTDDPSSPFLVDIESLELILHEVCMIYSYLYNPHNMIKGFYYQRIEHLNSTFLESCNLRF